MEILYDSPTTRISVINRNTYDVYLSFNGLTGDNITSDEMLEITDEFKSLSKDRTTFFIADKTMSWGNNVEWEKAVEVLQPYFEGKTVTAVGLSMGGSNAILSTQFFKINKVIAFNPQYSVYPDFYPESEYVAWSEKIETWRFKTIYSGFTPNTIYFLFWSTVHRLDTLYRNLFPNYANNFDFEHRYGHNIAGDLKKDGRLTELFELCKTNRVDLIHEFTKYNKAV